MNIIREIQKRLFPKTLKRVYRKDILEYTLKHYNYPSCENHAGLCISIHKALYYYGIDISSMAIKIIIPLFTMNNAISLFNAKPNYYWWPRGEWDSGRLDFLKWLLEQYKDDKTNLKEL